MASLICLILAVIFGALATTAAPGHPRFLWLPAAVTFLALAFLLGNLPALR